MKSHASRHTRRARFYREDCAEPRFGWETATSTLSIIAKAVSLNNSGSYHYIMQFTKEELNEIFAFLAKAALTDAPHFEKDFQLSLKAIAQRQAVVAGIKS